MEKVYKINSVKNPKVDTDYDAYCNEFDGKEVIGSNMIGVRDFDKPKKLYFTADFLSIPYSDFPFTDVSFPIISNRMFSILKNVKQFDCDIIPVCMLDDSFIGNQFDRKGKLKEEVPSNCNYLALQFKSCENVFDYSNSDFTKSLIFPEKVGTIKRLVLKVPKDGFKPLFKIKEAMEYVFVSEKAKQALELNNIKGCAFEEVETTPTVV